MVQPAVRPVNRDCFPMRPGTLLVELTEDEFLETFAFPFVDDELFVAGLGGGRQDRDAIRLYVSLMQE